MEARLGYIEIPAGNAERLADFLEAVFGWSTTSRDWSGGAYVMIEGAQGEVGCGIVESCGIDLKAPTPVVHVEKGSTERYLERVVAAGGSVVSPPRSVDDLGAFARFADSEGNTWGLWEAGSSGGVKG